MFKVIQLEKLISYILKFTPYSVTLWRKKDLFMRTHECKFLPRGARRGSVIIIYCGT